MVLFCVKELSKLVKIIVLSIFFDIIKLSLEVNMEVSKKIKGYQDVYDIQVENDHEYFANGILVHNCSDLKVEPK